MWDNLKASIASVVRTNNNQEITGANLQNVLNTIVNTVGVNATFAGIAIPSTNPGTPDGPVFYIACEPGVYSNFNLTLVDGLYILENKTGSWVGTQINTGAAFEALISYYNAVLNGASITVPDATTYRLTVGGDFKLKMSAPGTTATTLTIGNATNIPIWYNGAAVSEQNTWEANEIISVFYDGTRFMASNSQGGGGKAEKVFYDNSQSGLLVDNVQSAIDKIQDNINSQGELFRIALTNSNREYYLGGTLGSQVWRKSNTQYANTCYAVQGGHFYKLIANNNNITTYAFVKSLPTAAGAVDFADGGKNISYRIPAGEERIFQVPDDCVFLTFLSLAYKPSAFYELIEIPTYKLIENETLVNATDGRIVCSHQVVPPNSVLLYDFSIIGGSSTSPSCYLAIHKKDGTVTYIGKTSTGSGNVEYANQTILPTDYDFISIGGNSAGSMTVHKIHSTELVCGQIEKGIQAYNSVLFSKVLISSPTNLNDGTILFTDNDFKAGDAVHISIRALDEYSGYIEFYNANNVRISYWGKTAASFSYNEFEGDILIPSGFSYAKINAKQRQTSGKIIVNSVYRVPSDWGVYKIGNPMFQTLATYNANYAGNEITTENVFNTSTISNALKRIPTVIITNSGTVLAACEDRPSVSDGALTGIILARKASGGNSWTYINILPYNASSYGKLMNPCFVVDRNGAHGTIGRIYLFALSFVYSNTNQGMAYKCTTDEIAELYIYSDDDGLTWSSPILLNRSLWDTSKYTWMCNSPSNGIITTNGTMALACMGRIGGANGTWASGVLYKTPNGSWTFSEPSPFTGDNESTLFEGVKNNEIYLNCRNESFGTMRPLYKLDISDGSLEIVCNNFNPNLILQCCITKCTIDSNTCYLMTFPDPTAYNQRNRITVWASADGIRWTRVLRITGNTISAGYTMISCYNGKCVMVWENDGWNCKTIGYADLTPALELLKQSSLMCGDTPDDRIHRVACYQKSISV